VSLFLFALFLDYLLKRSATHRTFKRKFVLQIDLFNHACEAEVDVAF
jgi:hypothetical protein